MRARHIYYVILSAIILTSGGCKKNPKCWGDDKNKGEILQALSIDCLPYTEEEQMVIEDTATYRALFTPPEGESPSCNLPEIDFTLYSILGCLTEAQCSAKYKRTVEYTRASNKYYYEIKVLSCGVCESLEYNYNWVVVPKVQDGWRIEFQIIDR